ncbi:hypothetical protein KKA17_08600 [bacterium]|nr:hypothetical protein [bacterium]
MKLSIKAFMLLLYAIIVLFFTSISVYMYISQRDKMVDLIASDVQKNLLEVSYYASKVIDNVNNVSVVKPMIDRRIASNEIVDRFLIFHNEKLLFNSSLVNSDISGKTAYLAI